MPSEIPIDDPIEDLIKFVADYIEIFKNKIDKLTTTQKFEFIDRFVALSKKHVNPDDVQKFVNMLST